MTYLLLLVDAEGTVTARRLTVVNLREFPGDPGMSVHFRPVRNDLLFESAKVASHIAYRVLAGEGLVRAQLVVEYAVSGEHVNVTGRSSDLLFALALISAKWKTTSRPFPAIAATGALDMDGAALPPPDGANSVQGVRHTAAKVAAAVRELSEEPEAAVFYPATDAAEVESWKATAIIPAQVQLYPVGSLDEALACLGMTLEKVYLGNPFRGLEHFDYEHRSIFFGRDTEIAEVLAQLVRREEAGTPGLMVEGASGSGKSSFLRAGVLPALVNPSSRPTDIETALQHRSVPASASRAIWRVGLLVSGASEQVIAQSIRNCWRRLPELGEAIDGSVDTLADLAKKRRDAWPGGKRFVWLIDQFEELFSLGLSDPIIECFGRFLQDLQQEGVWTLASIRADAVPQLKQNAALRQVFGSNEGQYYLERMTGTALEDVIVRPAKAAGLTFGVSATGKSLDQMLRDEAYQDRDNALPLLQFTLYELYVRRSGRELTLAAYEELGGLSGSIATTAEVALQVDDAEAAQVAPRIFRSLISVDDEGRPSRRYAPAAEMTTDPGGKRLFDRLVAARLCVTDRRDGQALVAFAHEALLRTWPRLREWLAREGALIQSRDLLISEARRWEQHGERGDWLIVAPDRLTSMRRVIESSMPLPEVARRFGSQSTARARRMARLRQSVMASMAALAITATAFGFYLQRERNKASQAIAAQFEARAWRLLRNGDLAPGVRYALASAIIGPRTGGEPAPVLLASRLETDRSQLLAGHADLVRTIAFSPDGRHAVTASEDHTARLWDTSSGREVANLKHDNKVWQATFSPDGKRILTASGDNTARIWDATDGRLLQSLEHGNKAVSSVLQAVYSQNGSRIVTVSSDGTAWTWDTASGQPLARLQDGITTLDMIQIVQARLVAELHHATQSTSVPVMTGLRQAAFSPDGRFLVTASTNGTAQVWDAESGHERLRLRHEDVITLAAFSPDGRWIATASRDHTARVWNATNGHEIARLSHDAAVSRASFSPDGTKLVTASDDGTARIWDVTESAEGARARSEDKSRRDAYLAPDLQRMRSAIARATNHADDTAKTRELFKLAHEGKVLDAAFSPDGVYVITSAEDRTARIWNASDGLEIVQLHHSAVVDSAVFSRDSSRVATLSHQNTAQIWETSRSLGLELRHDANVRQAVFSPNGRYVLTASDDHTARMWDASSGKPIWKLPHDGAVRAVAFSRDGTRVIVSAGDKSAVIWDLGSGKEIGRLTHAINRIRHAAFSPDGKKIVTAGEDLTARIWDTESQRELVRLTHEGFLNSAVFSPDGLTVLTACADHSARIWDVTTGRQIARLQHDMAVRQADFSPDGRVIVTASDDHTARLWDAANGRELNRLVHGDKARNSVLHASFSLDGMRVVTASSDNTARVWDTDSGQELARFIHAGAVLSAFFSPDGRHIVTASSDRTARIWDVSSGQELMLIQRATLMRQAVFSPDGRKLVTAADNTARIWDTPALTSTTEQLDRTICAWLPPGQHRFSVDEIEGDPLIRDVLLANGRANNDICKEVIR